MSIFLRKLDGITVITFFLPIFTLGSVIHSCVSIITKKLWKCVQICYTT